MTGGLRTIPAARIAAARALVQSGVLSAEAYVAWGMAESGISHRAIARERERSKGTVTDQIARARRLVDEEVARCRASAE